MKLNCDQCGKPLIGDAKFCPYCGEMAPQKTILFEEEKQIIANPKYCPECKAVNLQEALFCMECGSRLHSRPDNPTFYCGVCGEKNKTSAKVCCNCGLNFEDWFAMRGKITSELGYKGDLILTEKMTGITYQFLSPKKFSIGRTGDNDMSIPCKWVSRHHCNIDIENKIFNDTSTNGTFINRKSEHISKEQLELVGEFNVAQSFTFYLVKEQNLFGFRLGAILDEDDCRRNGDGDAFDRLRKVYTFLYWGTIQLYQ